MLRAYEAGEWEGAAFLAVEFVEGCNAYELVRDSERLPIGIACGIVRDAAVGLQHLHERGTIHRDIKPQNLLLAKSGVVKVSDLGLARHNWREDTGGIKAQAEGNSVLQWQATTQQADISTYGLALIELGDIPDGVHDFVLDLRFNRPSWREGGAGVYLGFRETATDRAAFEVLTVSDSKQKSKPLTARVCLRAAGLSGRFASAI